jgi:hypothetical protein
MSDVIQDLPEDPLKIFFRLEDDIHSLVDYVAVLVSVTSNAEMDEDQQCGVHRLLLDVQDRGLALREGFRKAFPPKEETA